MTGSSPLPRMSAWPERVLRAGGAILAGLSIAWEHLHTEPEDPEPTVALVVLHACPHCGTSLTAGPHLHGDAMIWATAHDGSVLVTARDGTDPFIVTGHTA